MSVFTSCSHRKFNVQPVGELCTGGRSEADWRSRLPRRRPVPPPPPAPTNHLAAWCLTPGLPDHLRRSLWTAGTGIEGFPGLFFGGNLGVTGLDVSFVDNSRSVVSLVKSRSVPYRGNWLAPLRF